MFQRLGPCSRLSNFKGDLTRARFYGDDPPPSACPIAWGTKRGRLSLAKGDCMEGKRAMHLALAHMEIGKLGAKNTMDLINLPIFVIKNNLQGSLQGVSTQGKAARRTFNVGATPNDRRQIKRSLPRFSSSRIFLLFSAQFNGSSLLSCALQYQK